MQIGYLRQGPVPQLMLPNHELFLSFFSPFKKNIYIYGINVWFYVVGGVILIIHSFFFSPYLCVVLYICVKSLLGNGWLG